MAVVMLLLFALAVSCHRTAAVNMTGCIYNEPWPMIFDAIKEPQGDIYTPGFHEGMYPDWAYCDYTIKAAPGHIIKLTFKEMELESASRCSKDKVFVVDGPNADGEDLGAYCGMEPPPYPIISKQNAMHLSFRSNHQLGRKGFHAHYEAIRPEDVCPRGYQKCANNNCYHPNQKCNGEDECGDGTDEENCGRPLPTTTCGSGSILPIESSSSPDRIVGGTEARPGSWPWQVDLQLPRFYPEAHTCGGTLLNAEWVMTALHCLGGNPYPENWRIILGNHNRFLKDPDQQHRYVTRLVIFPGYTGDDILGKPIDFTHDIALMKLNAPVKFSDRVKPACLPPEGYELPLGTKCIATGWGESRGSGYHEQLKQAELYTQQDNKCANMVNTSMICVKSQLGLQDACHGDSGGPLNCKIGDKWHVMGITSFGSATNMMSGLCAVSNYGTVFNKVSAKISWINEMIQKYI